MDWMLFIKRATFIMCDNIVLSDIVPISSQAPSLWPIVIYFGKARSLKSPKTYRLTEKEKMLYLQTYTHLAPELVSGLNPQSITTDIFSLGVIIHRVAHVIASLQLKSLSNLCIGVTSNRPSMMYVQESLTAN